VSIKTAEDRRRYQHRKTAYITYAFLRECYDKKLSGSQIQKEHLKRTGILIGVETFRYRMVQVGIRPREKYLSKRVKYQVVGRKDCADVPKFDRDEVEIIRRLEINNMEEKMRRDDLEREAKSGNLTALATLFVRYRIRYPLVEEDLIRQAKKARRKLVLPWLADGGGNGNGTARTLFQKPVSREVKRNGTEIPPRGRQPGAARSSRRVRLNFDFGRKTGEDYRHFPPPHDSTT